MNNCLSIELMSQTSGGSKFVDGFCATLGVVDAGMLLGIFTISRIGAIVIGSASLGCAIYYFADQND